MAEKKRGPKGNRKAMAMRRDRVAKLLLQGWTQAAIAVELGVTEAQISIDAKAIREDWKKERIDSFEEHVNQELARINNLERTCWEAWLRTLEPRKRTEVKMKGGGGTPEPEQMEKIVREYIRDGEPAYLKCIENCGKERRKLLGLYAPTKHTVDPGDEMIEVIKMGGMEVKFKKNGGS